MLLIGALVAATSLASASDDVWARFSAHHALSRLEIDVEIGIADRTPGKPIYRIRRSTKKFRGKPQISEVDTRSCPAMLAALKSLGDLQMPRANLPLQDDFIIITADGTAYSLTMPAAYPNAATSDITLTSKDDTPLAAWVDNALATLDSCMPR
jgi:hypothetical protein